MLLQALLIANGVLLFFVIVTAVARFCKANKESYHNNMNIDENALKQEDEPVEEVVPVKAETVNPTPVEEPILESEPLEPAVEPEKEVAVAEDVEEELIIGSLDESVKDNSFATKLLSLDESVQGYYDKINNEFGSYRRVHGRVSKAGVSYRLGRDLIAKLTIRGKTMRLNLALDVKDFSEKLYFQKDMRDVKAYQDIPFMVKVKSDRGLMRAKQLIEALAVKENIEKKARYFPIDSIENLKNLKK